MQARKASSSNIDTSGAAGAAKSLLEQVRTLTLLDQIKEAKRSNPVRDAFFRRGK